MKPLPLLGTRANLLRFFSDPVGWMLRLAREQGDAALIREEPDAVWCLLGAEHNRRVLSDPTGFLNNERLPVRVPADGAVQRLETNLVLMNGEAHRRRRRMMMPSFHKSAIATYRDEIVALTENAIQSWSFGEVRDLGNDLIELTLRISMRCFFGLELGAEARDLGRLGTEHLDGMTSVGAILFPVALPGTPYAKLTRASEKLEARLLDLVARKRAAQGESRDVLGMMLGARDEDGSALSDRELIGDAAGLFLAGHETTAQTLAWTLFLLAMHPRVQADLVEELESALSGEAPSLDDLARLPLLDRVVRESMRILPAVPLLFIRYASEDRVLGTRSISQSSAVILSPLVTHRAPELYTEPDRFDPERWNALRPSLYEYLPFGAGPRMCVGAAFASMSIRVVLAQLLQRFRFSLADGARIDRRVRGVTLGPKRGLPLRLNQEITSSRPPRGDIHELVRLS